MATESNTITVGQIISERGLPNGATAVVWRDTRTVETAEQVADPGNLSTMSGIDYDPGATGQLVYDEIPEGAVGWKFNDPVDDARWLTVEDDTARIAHEDPSLVAHLADYSFGE